MSGYSDLLVVVDNGVSSYVKVLPTVGVARPCSPITQTGVVPTPVGGTNGDSNGVALQGIIGQFTPDATTTSSGSASDSTGANYATQAVGKGLAAAGTDRVPVNMGTA